MNKYIYRLNKNILKTEEGKTYTAYDVEAWTVKNRTYCLAESIPNVFLEYERAKNFIDSCNFLEISLVHLMDVIEDELS